MEKKIVYFESAGLDNTDSALEFARERAAELGISTLVLASTRGWTAEKALSALHGFHLVVVGIDRERFSKETAEKLRGMGIPVLFSRELAYRYPEDMKTAFRRFSQGMKVAVEDVVAGCQARSVESGVEVVSIAGSSRGADTAIVVSTAWDFASVKVREIICIPR